MASSLLSTGADFAGYKQELWQGSTQVVDGVTKNTLFSKCPLGLRFEPSEEAVWGTLPH